MSIKNYTKVSLVLIVDFLVGLFIGLLFSLFLYFAWILALLIGFKMAEVKNSIEFILFAIGVGVGGLFLWSGLPHLGGSVMAWGTTLFLLIGFYSKKIYLYFFTSKSLPK